MKWDVQKKIFIDLINIGIRNNIKSGIQDPFLQNWTITNWKTQILGENTTTTFYSSASTQSRLNKYKKKKKKQRKKKKASKYKKTVKQRTGQEQC